MGGPLALALVLAAAAPAAAPEADPFATLLASPPLSVVGLADSARKLEALRVAADGVADVEGVRRRLGALTALSGLARPYLRGDDAEARIAAHAIVAAAHERFAEVLANARAPQRATGDAARAWAEQVDTTIRSAVGTAAAHLRSCRELSGVTKLQPDLGRACGERVAKLAPDPVRRRGQAEASAAVGARLPELQPCFDRWAEAHRGAAPVQLTATLKLDGLGRVHQVGLAPATPDLAALRECIEDGIGLWVLPALADTDLELPLRVAAR